MLASHGRPAKFGAGMATVASAFSQSQVPAPAPAPAASEEATAGAAIVPQEAAAGDKLPGEAASGAGSLERPAQSSPSSQQQQQLRLTLASWLGISEQQITRFKEDLTRYLTAIKPSVLDEVRKENENIEAMLAKKEFREFKAYMQRMHTLEKKLKDADADLSDVRLSAQVQYCVPAWTLGLLAFSDLTVASGVCLHSTDLSKDMRSSSRVPRQGLNG